ncbi:MAG: glycosyltransferase [Planctomycetota bacterium]
MRVALVAHELAPHRRGGIASHTAALARALARAGVEVEVFTLRPLAGLTPLAQRREERAAGDEPFAVTYLDASPTDHQTEEGERRIAEAFGAFLDRERPEIVHFEHLLGLGPAGVMEARQRGIPTVFVAHDWWAVHDNLHLVQPDLTTFEPGDHEAEARGRLALRWLEGLAAADRSHVADPHGALLREQLSGANHARLHAFLHGPGTSAGTAASTGSGAGASARLGARPGRPEVPHIEAELERTRARLAAKRAALSQVDARFASSRALSRRLSALVGRAFSFRAPGVDRERIAVAPRIAPVAVAEGPSPLRVGFVGSIVKERGLHVLLDALAGIEGKVELHVHGDSTDRSYVARCRRRAEALGAVWHGGYNPDDLPQRLAALDAVCLPSLWSDNAPLVLREAYAAGLPVVVSDTEALRESVLPTTSEERREVDAADALGLLVPAGDVGALRAALVRLAEDEALRATLAERALKLEGPLAKRLAQEAGEWIATYAQLHGAALKRRVPQPVPAHLAGLARDVARLEAQPTRLLFQEVTQGLVRLGAAVGLDVTATELMTLAVGRGSRTRDERAADARALDWLRASVRELGDARSALESRSKWRAQQLEDLGDRVAWFEQRVREREFELVNLRAERDDHGSAREHLEEERRQLRDAIEAREREHHTLMEQLDEARGALRSLAEERDWLRDTLDRGSEELRWLREHIAGDIEDALTDREAIEIRFERLCSEHESLENHELWLRREVAAMLETLGGPAQQAPEDPSDLERALTHGRERLGRLVAELRWRRGEMDAARTAASSLITRLAGGNLASRARSWVSAAPSDALGRASEAFEPPLVDVAATEDRVVTPMPRGAGANAAPKAASKAGSKTAEQAGRANAGVEREASLGTQASAAESVEEQ